MRRIAIGLFVLALAGPAVAEEYRNPKRGIRVELPPGWEVAPDSVVPQAGWTQGFKFIAAFRKQGTEGLAYPYVLVQFTGAPLEGKSADGLEEALHEQEQKLASQGIEEFRYDRASGRAIIRLAIDVPGLGRVRGRAVEFFANDGMIGLLFYDREDDFVSSRHAFDFMVDGFRFDPGREWEPATSLPKPVLYGLLGAAVGAAAGLIVWLARKKDRSLLSARSPRRTGRREAGGARGRSHRGRPPRGRRRR